MTDGFIEPTATNFALLIIKNGSEISDKIKKSIQTTKPWLKSKADTQQVEVFDANGVQAEVTSELV